MTGTSKFIRLERHDSHSVLTINRHDARNAVNIDMLRALDRSLDDLYTSPPRVLVLTAASPGFCAGIDLKESRETSPTFANTRVRLMHRVLSRLRRLPVPVIGAIDGVATGLGCELAISADIRLITSESRFSYPEPRVAVPSPAHHLVQLIGLARAQDMLLSARWVDAAEAVQIGLASRIVEDLGSAVLSQIENFASMSPQSLMRTKESLILAIDGDATSASEHHIQGVTEAAWTNDRREALAAFAEKRPPVFKGE